MKEALVEFCIMAVIGFAVIVSVCFCFGLTAMLLIVGAAICLFKQIWKLIFPAKKKLCHCDEKP
ncbi:MAG: hypothetical protein AAB674_01180 [Patescibacteria group bacterium]